MLNNNSPQPCKTLNHVIGDPLVGVDQLTNDTTLSLIQSHYSASITAFKQINENFAKMAKTIFLQ